MTRPAAWLARNVPLRLTARVASRSSSRTSSAGFPGAMPALLTRMSRRPNQATAASTAGPDLPGLGHVHLQRQRAPAQRLDLRGHAAVGAGVAQPERDVRAGRGERERDGPAEPAGRPGHQRDLPAHVEPRQYRHYRVLISPALQ